MDEQQKKMLQALIKIYRETGDLFHEKAYIVNKLLVEEETEDHVFRLIEIMKRMMELSKQSKEISNKGLERIMKKMGINLPEPPPVPVNDDPVLS